MPRWLIPRSAPARVAWQVLLLAFLVAAAYWLTNWLAADLASSPTPLP